MTPAQQKRVEANLEAFQQTLPEAYQTFSLDRHPNPGLYLDLFRRWTATSTHLDHKGKPEPEAGIIGEIGPDGLLLFGQPRTGKTRAACELARKVLEDDSDVRGVFLPMSRWGSELTPRSWRSSTMEKLEAAYESFPLVVLDDIDKVRPTPANQVELFNLIEYLTTNGDLPQLIVTTNVTADRLAKRFGEYGEAIVGRLTEACVPIDFNQTIPYDKPKEIDDEP